MKLPAEILNLRDRYVDAFPLWSVAPSEESEERARTWTLGLISQIEYEFPGKWYGSKRADPGRPLSKDAIAQKQASGQLFGWDMLTGTGSGAPMLNADPDSMDITGQIYEFIEGRDVIGGAEAPDGGGGSSEDGIPYNDEYAVQFGLACNDVYKECGMPIDPGMVSVHTSRASWDYYVGGMSWEDSYSKHLNEFRAVYGLPPV